MLQYYFGYMPETLVVLDNAVNEVMSDSACLKQHLSWQAAKTLTGLCACPTETLL
jgi:hypothetical protein